LRLIFGGAQGMKNENLKSQMLGGQLVTHIELIYEIFMGRYHCTSVQQKQSSPERSNESDASNFTFKKFKGT